MTTLMALFIIILVFLAALAAAVPPFLGIILLVIAYLNTLLRGPFRNKKL